MALLLDHAILFFGIFPASAFLAFFLGPAWPLAPFLALIGYFALSAPRTLGMRVAGIGLVDASTSAPAQRVTATVRGLLGLILLVGFFITSAVLFSDNVDAHGNESYGLEVIIPVLAVGLLVMLLGAAIHLWMFGNPERRALHDLITGVRVVRWPPGD